MGYTKHYYAPSNTFCWPPDAIMHTDRHVSKSTKLDGTISPKALRDDESGSYVPTRLGRMPTHIPLPICHWCGNRSTLIADNE